MGLCSKSTQIGLCYCRLCLPTLTRTRANSFSPAFVLMPPKSLAVCSLTFKLFKYRPSFELQERLVQLRKADSIQDTLLLVQHHPVFTIGKRGSTKDILSNSQDVAAAGIEVVHVPRGGETTYHGPGQLVAYPVFNLRQLGLGARSYVDRLEDVMVQTVGCFAIQAQGHVPGKTGVWIGDRKIGAVGVRITHGISSHGIALNVCTNLSHYKHITPCGTPGIEVTSLQQELFPAKARQQSASRTAPEKSAALCAASIPTDSDGSSLQDFRVAEQHLMQSFARVFGFDTVDLLDQQQLPTCSTQQDGSMQTMKGARAMWPVTAWP